MRRDGSPNHVFYETLTSHIPLDLDTFFDIFIPLAYPISTRQIISLSILINHFGNRKWDYASKRSIPGLGTDPDRPYPCALD